MDTSYCSSLAKNKLDHIINAPVDYLFNDIITFFRLAFSENWYHCVPTIVFIVSVTIVIQDQVDCIVLKQQRTHFRKNKYKMILNMLKIGMVAMPLAVFFCSWVLIQELVYCVAWFLTSEGLNPDLLDKWWFKRSNDTSEASESFRSFIEVVPPEILSWIIMTLTASFILVISVNSTTESMRSYGVRCISPSIFTRSLRNGGKKETSFQRTYVESNRNDSGNSSDAEIELDRSFREPRLESPSVTPEQDGSSHESEARKIARLLQLKLDKNIDMDSSYRSDMNDDDIISASTSRLRYQDDGGLSFSLLQPLKPPPYQTFY